MMATTNEENFKQMYKGFQSVPKPYQTNGFSITVYGNNGSIQTPWFGEHSEDMHYNEDRYHQIVLTISEAMTDNLEAGSLVILLEVETREEEGWEEVVEYIEGSRYKLHNKSKTWEEAEAHCQGKGGDLVSVLTEEEQQEVVALAAPAAAVADHVWIGGSYVQGEGVWKWSDGSPWNYTKWNRSLRTGINCVALHHGVLWDTYQSRHFNRVQALLCHC